VTEPKTSKKLNKKQWVSWLLLFLLSGGLSVEVEASESHWRFAVTREENSLMKLFDWFNP
jgi:hypothetical protein